MILGTLVIVEGLNRFMAVSAIIILLGGTLVWLFGFAGVHIGASGWVFGLWAYLLSRAWFQRSWSNLITASVVVLLYGGLIFLASFLARACPSKGISLVRSPDLLQPRYCYLRRAAGLMPSGNRT